MVPSSEDAARFTSTTDIWRPQSDDHAREFPSVDDGKLVVKGNETLEGNNERFISTRANEISDSTHGCKLIDFANENPQITGGG